MVNSESEDQFVASRNSSRDEALRRLVARKLSPPVSTCEDSEALALLRSELGMLDASLSSPDQQRLVI
jgi:hypothetical protein